MAARVIAIQQGKGGVAKTTTAVNLAHELATKKKKVLLIDLDAQANATSYFRNAPTEFYIGDVLLNHKFDIRQAIYPALVRGEVKENLFIIPARGQGVMRTMEETLITLRNREDRLSDQLKAVVDDFDFIIIDTAPTINTTQTNATCAATEYIFPIDGNNATFSGIEDMITAILDAQYKVYKAEDEINFMILPVVISRSMTRTIKDIKDYCEIRFPHNLAKTIIWQKQRNFEDAGNNFVPISVWAKSSEEAMYYKRFADEVISNE